MSVEAVTVNSLLRVNCTLIITLIGEAIATSVCMLPVTNSTANPVP